MKPWEARKAGREWACILAMWTVFLAGCGGGALNVPAPTPTADSIAGLAGEFKRLRTVKGHFEGGAWNDDVDRWMGRKHQLMIELGERLGQGTYDRSQAVDLLGDPDAIAREGDALYDRIQNRGEFERPSGGGYEFPIYHWRGEHDFLYLVAREEVILGAGWWYAGD